MQQPGLHHRHRDKNGEISRKHGNTLVRMLRRIYGSDSAAGEPETAKLQDVLHTLDELSLSALVPDHEPGHLESRIAQHAPGGAGVEAQPTPASEKEIYRSSNGDQWSLVEEAGTQRLLVRHQPNRASGGQSSLIELKDFLEEGHGPQQEALRRLLAAPRRS